MKDLRAKYKTSGWDYHPRRHWKRRWLNDLRKLTDDHVAAAPHPVPPRNAPRTACCASCLLELS